MTGPSFETSVSHCAMSCMVEVNLVKQLLFKLLLIDKTKNQGYSLMVKKNQLVFVLFI